MEAVSDIKETLTDEGSGDQDQPKQSSMIFSQLPMGQPAEADQGPSFAKIRAKLMTKIE